MTNTATQQDPKRKTPDTATGFEREQLQFFLSQGDLASTLAEINPSLAWLPLLSEMKLIQGETQLVGWIERNFADIYSVRDVVANLRFFGPDTANILDYRLNTQFDTLPPLVAKCWRLIIRHMRNAKQGILQNEWFELAPRIKRGETSADLSERIANALQPRLVLSKRLSFRDTGEEVPEHPSDLMAIDYEVEDGLSPDEVLEAWPTTATAETDDKLLSSLANALNASLDDATDVGVEAPHGYGVSDADVPSVAMHCQNAYRSGFYPIVRVMADLWGRLAKKSPVAALRFVENWRRSPFRLPKRLALFAGADLVVPATLAADMLLTLPQGELFLTNSSVEVFRLIQARWKEFEKPAQEAIFHHVCIGPPRDWFRPDGEIDRAVDRSRFDILAEMERQGLDLSGEAEMLLKDIRTRWPQWRLTPAAQAGFHVWHSSGSTVVGDAEKLDGVADDQLVAEANKIAATDDFLDADNWQALCLSDPDRALRGLDAAAAEGNWSKALWRDLLWSRTLYTRSTTEAQIGQLLLKWPKETFPEIVSPAAAWLDEHSVSLGDALLWPLWDRIADASLTETVVAKHA